MSLHWADSMIDLGGKYSSNTLFQEFLTASFFMAVSIGWFQIKQKKTVVSPNLHLKNIV